VAGVARRLGTWLRSKQLSQRTELLGIRIAFRGDGESRCLVDEDLYVAGGELSTKCLWSILEHVFADKGNQLLSEVVFDLVVIGGIERARGRIRRMDIEAAIRLLLDVKREFQLACWSGKLQAREVGAQASQNCGLNFLLQLLARSGFDRWDARIARAGDESTFRLWLDAIDIFRNQVLDFHGRIVSRRRSREKTSSRYWRLSTLASQFADGRSALKSGRTDAGTRLRDQKEGKDRGGDGQAAPK